MRTAGAATSRVMRLRRGLWIGAVAAGAGIVAWLAGEFRQEMTLQRARVAAGSRIVDTRCGAIEVAESGPADAAPLLVVHGSGGGFDQGLTIGADYAARGWRVIAPSRFGYLRTPWPADARPGDPAIGGRQADALACLLDALGLPEAAVMGVSAGAAAATEFAARHASRTRALILMVPAGHRPDTAAALPGWAQAVLESVIAAEAPLWFFSRFAPVVVHRFVLATPPAEVAAAPAAEQQRAARLMREIQPLAARRLGLLHDTVATQAVPRPPFEAITAPTLAIGARDDGFGTLAAAAHAAQQIRGARLLVFERGGHLLLNHGAETSAAVDALLRTARLTSH